MAAPGDIAVEALPAEELRRLVGELLGEAARLREENAALREEVARLKGLPGRPKLKPSGMERATAPRGDRLPGATKGAVRTTERVVHEERVLAITAPPGSRFKGYEDVRATRTSLSRTCGWSRA
jgi:hypothetical protein